jgi:hypothetical protein
MNKATMIHFSKSYVKIIQSQTLKTINCSAYRFIANQNNYQVLVTKSLNTHLLAKLALCYW